MFMLAIASCSRVQDLSPQPAWAEIQAAQPDAVLLLGDNIYLRHDHHRASTALAADLRQHYELQFAEPGFASLVSDLRARGKPLLAIYDDHDFLGNNRYGGDHDPALRSQARAEFVRAFAPPLTGEDVYHHSRFGLVDLVVLDARFYRTHPAVAAGDRDAILGTEQWRWFEDCVRASSAPYLVVASSTTVHTIADESWEQYPGAFRRLVTLLGGRKGALVVSGDVHRNAVYDDSGVLEITTSAVARRGVVYGAERRNHGLLGFDPGGVRVELRSLKVSGRFDFRVELDAWRLP